MAKVIIDSDLTLRDAIGLKGPDHIRAQQKVLVVSYIGFDNQEHRGQIIINNELAADVTEWFKLALQLKFPINKVIPASTYNFDDNQLMAANITSGFNYRKIAGTSGLSPHALGRAFDVNPKLNPYIHKLGDRIITDPAGAIRDLNKPGTLTSDHRLVSFMMDRGWEWGGNWSLEKSGRVDYHHFQKL